MTATTPPLTSYLLARYTEAERGPMAWLAERRAEMARMVADEVPIPLNYVEPDGRSWVVAPSDILRSTAAKRRVVELHTNPHDYAYCPVCIDWETETPLGPNCPTLRALGDEFAYRDDFREEWR